MKESVIIILTMVVMFGLYLFVDYIISPDKINVEDVDVGIGDYTEKDLLFQGPVKQGYDEYLFRLTGEHKEIN